jgi:hypothetical protein
MLAVAMQNEDMLAESFYNIDGDGGSNTGIGYGGESGENEGGLVKGHSIWDDEW